MEAPLDAPGRDADAVQVATRVAAPHTNVNNDAQDTCGAQDNSPNINRLFVGRELRPHTRTGTHAGHKK